MLCSLLIVKVRVSFVRIFIKINIVKTLNNSLAFFFIFEMLYIGKNTSTWNFSLLYKTVLGYNNIKAF